MSNLQTPHEQQVIRLHEPALLRPEDVARSLQISRTRVYDLIRDGSLRSVKVGSSRRVTPSALGDFISSLEPFGGGEAV